MRAVIAAPEATTLATTDYFAVRRSQNNMLINFANMATAISTKIAPNGTWTPTLAGTTVAGTATYTTRSGMYVQMQHIIFISCNIVFTAFTGTGNITITGLPIAPAASTGYVEYFPVSPLFMNHTASITGAGTIYVRATMAKVTSGSLVITLTEVENTTTETAFPVQTTGTFSFQGFYFI